MSLAAGYEIKEMSPDDFSLLWAKHAGAIFDDHSQIFRVYEWLDEEEKNKARQLRSLMGTPYQLCLGLFYKNEFVGWCSGHQESAETFYMRNSAVFVEHRRKGLYTALLKKALELIKEKGFQKIYSRHNATNNDVIIPKLKAGFNITSLEVSDMFGVLVHLTYFSKPLRKKILTYRVGDLKPDAEIKECLKI